ncbi:ABC-F family ATP-binding cassette domain-containing protein [Sphingosinicella microcystinivorans]|uniref:ABC-F family ATP-binding cassette domain-containing protein n=1 Tax=Sphingosinicella microcystinivorans TaxID=335406 RepID=UPI0022F392A8|nr:ATP-binding cassette domain-containing protein [Sphingosinicella microcystinivorans]WBX83179.1 ATP-binding cassette domain-containing protein [Sphingosinicella microcystinivorans]
MSAPIVSLESIGLVQGTGWLFRGLDLFIGERDRLALIGRNGAGKTTLFRLIAGLTDFDEGARKARPGTHVVLLEQDPKVTGYATLRDFAMRGPGAPAVHEVEAIADQIGLDLSRAAETASGGERRRAALARALAENPDLILLDEPTNHLDLAAIEWLEGWLGRYTGAFVAISHDRTFLTRLTRSSLWLDRGRLRRAEIGFGGFEAWTEQIYAEEARAAEKLDSKLKDELHWLQRGVTARRRRNQGRLAKLQEMRAQRASMIGQAGKAKLGLQSDDAKAKIVIDAEGVGKAYDGRTIIRDLTIRIQRGDRIGIVGPNGAGKTTLLKLLTGEIAPDTGTVRQAKTLAGITIDQQRKLLEPGKRVRDILADGGDWIDVRGEKKHVIGYLKEFLFDPSVADAPVDALSGGERSRLLLAREFARASNLLVLDEPTNDLDLETLDLLQEVIADYEGTVLIVSHDRDFLDRTVTMVVGLDGSGRADVVAGGFADWEKKRAQRTAAKPNAAPAAEVPRTARTKLSYKDQRELDLLPGEIEALNAEIARHEEALARSDFYTRDPEGFMKVSGALDCARARLTECEDRWLELAERAEMLG